MRVTVLLFAALAEQTGTRQLTLDLPAAAPARAVWELLRREHPAWGELGQAVILAINGEFQPPESALHDGDTVALLPPMSGGAAAAPPLCYTALVRGPLPPAPLWADAAIGAVVLFEGVARGHTPSAPGKRVLRLEYEAYEDMARARLAAIARDAAARWPLRALEIVHRLGSVPVGEASVRVLAAAAHRGPAFDACRFAIDALKSSVPVWKKEYFADGSHWAEGHFPLTASAAPTKDNPAPPAG